MTGEAFFEVAHDARHPFIIYSGGVITRVWGTSFRIKTDKNTLLTEVVVVTGKVSVQLREKNLKQKIGFKNTSEVILLPNQKVTYFKKDDRLKKADKELSAGMQIWNKVDKNFENVPVKEVIAYLNKTFDVNIRIEDERLNNYLFNADFTDQNLPAIIEMLEKSFNATHTINEREIFLRKR